MIYEIGISYPGTELDQQVKLDLSKTFININRLKFYYENNVISHWVEDYDNQIIWVKVPILNNNTKIYLTDEQSKKLSNGFDVFDFFNDFDSGVINYEFQENATLSTSIDPIHGHYIYIPNSNQVTPINAVKYTLTTPGMGKFILESYNYMTTKGSGHIFQLSDGTNLVGAHVATGKTGSTDISYDGELDYYTSDWIHTGYYVPISMWFKTRMEYDFSTNTFNVYINDILRISNGGNVFGNILPKNSTIIWSQTVWTDMEHYIDDVKQIKYLQFSPKILYIKPYHKSNYYTNTIFNENKNILNYNNNSYIEFPIIEISNSSHGLLNINNIKLQYYRYSDIQPDITESGILSNNSRYWDSNTITNSGWNNITPSSYITYSSETEFKNTFVQFKIQIT